VTLLISKERRNREYKAYLKKDVKMSTRLNMKDKYIVKKGDYKWKN